MVQSGVVYINKRCSTLFKMSTLRTLLSTAPLPSYHLNQKKSQVASTLLMKINYSFYLLLISLTYVWFWLNSSCVYVTWTFGVFVVWQQTVMNPLFRWMTARLLRKLRRTVIRSGEWLPDCYGSYTANHCEIPFSGEWLLDGCKSYDGWHTLHAAKLMI